MLTYLKQICDNTIAVLIVDATLITMRVLVDSSDSTTFPIS